MHISRIRRRCRRTVTDEKVTCSEATEIMMMMMMMMKTTATIDDDD